MPPRLNQGMCFLADSPTAKGTQSSLLLHIGNPGQITQDKVLLKEKGSEGLPKGQSVTPLT